jgi:hypothetical protein
LISFSNEIVKSFETKSLHLHNKSLILGCFWLGHGDEKQSKTEDFIMKISPKYNLTETCPTLSPTLFPKSSRLKYNSYLNTLVLVTTTTINLYIVSSESPYLQLIHTIDDVGTIEWFTYHTNPDIVVVGSRSKGISEEIPFSQLTNVKNVPVTLTDEKTKGKIKLSTSSASSLFSVPKKSNKAVYIPFHSIHNRSLSPVSIYSANLPPLYDFHTPFDIPIKYSLLGLNKPKIKTSDSTALFTITVYYSQSVLIQDEIERRKSEKSTTTHSHAEFTFVNHKTSEHIKNLDEESEFNNLKGEGLYSISFYKLYKLQSFDHEMEINKDILYPIKTKTKELNFKLPNSNSSFYSAFSTLTPALNSSFGLPSSFLCVSSTAQVLLVYGAPYLFITSPRNGILTCFPLFIDVPVFPRSKRTKRDGL